MLNQLEAKQDDLFMSEEQLSLLNYPHPFYVSDNMGLVGPDPNVKFSEHLWSSAFVAQVGKERHIAFEKFKKTTVKKNQCIKKGAHATCLETLSDEESKLNYRKEFWSCPHCILILLTTQLGKVCRVSLKHRYKVKLGPIQDSGEPFTYLHQSQETDGDLPTSFYFNEGFILKISGPVCDETFPADKCTNDLMPGSPQHLMRTVLNFTVWLKKLESKYTPHELEASSVLVCPVAEVATCSRAQLFINNHRAPFRINYALNIAEFVLKTRHIVWKMGLGIPYEVVVLSAQDPSFYSYTESFSANEKGRIALTESTLHYALDRYFDLLTFGNPVNYMIESWV